MLMTFFYTETKFHIEGTICLKVTAEKTERADILCIKFNNIRHMHVYNKK